MYSNHEIAIIRKNFWTKFGQYMKPLPGANGTSVNWLNYKTGVKDFYFRMDVQGTTATISLEARQPEQEVRMIFFEQLEQLKALFSKIAGNDWVWQKEAVDEDGRLLSCISKSLHPVNILNHQDWPAIISFLKPAIMQVDEFWNMVRENFS